MLAHSYTQSMYAREEQSRTQIRICKKKNIRYSQGIAAPARAPPDEINRKLPHPLGQESRIKGKTNLLSMNIIRRSAMRSIMQLPIECRVWERGRRITKSFFNCPQIYGRSGLCKRSFLKLTRHDSQAESRGEIPPLQATLGQILFFCSHTASRGSSRSRRPNNQPHHK